jgi:membrane-associated phospholipid phosphatase
MTRIFKAWIGGLLLTTMVTWISVAWFDKPIAIFVAGLFEHRPLQNELATQTPGFSIPFVSAVVFTIFGFAALLGRNFSKFETAVLLADISLLVTEPIKNLLKFVFGRTWPDSWAPGILSLIRDNEFGFHFFQGGRSFESFPSGHAAVTAAVTSVLWLMYPRLGFVWAIGIVAANIGLVLLNLHFLSDVVAGTFVGVSSGLFTAALCAPGGHVLRAGNDKTAPVDPDHKQPQGHEVQSNPDSAAGGQTRFQSSFRPNMLPRDDMLPRGMAADDLRASSMDDRHTRPGGRGPRFLGPDFR